MAKQLITLTVNGDEYELAVAPYQTLLEVLRDELGLTGTKRGCTGGSCGVCTVNVEEGEAVLSCCALAIEWDGRNRMGEIVNIGPYLYQVRIGTEISNGVIIIGK